MVQALTEILQIGIYRLSLFTDSRLIILWLRWLTWPCGGGSRLRSSYVLLELWGDLLGLVEVPHGWGPLLLQIKTLLWELEVTYLALSRSLMAEVLSCSRLSLCCENFEVTYLALSRSLSAEVLSCSRFCFCWENSCFMLSTVLS